MPPCPSFVPVCPSNQLDYAAATCTQQATVGIFNNNVDVGTLHRPPRQFPGLEFTSFDSLSESALSDKDITVCLHADVEDERLLASDRCEHPHQAIGKSEDAFVVENYMQKFEIVLLSSVARLEAAVGMLASSSAASMALRPMGPVEVLSDTINEVKREEEQVPSFCRETSSEFGTGSVPRSTSPESKNIRASHQKDIQPWKHRGSVRFSHAFEDTNVSLLIRSTTTETRTPVGGILGCRFLMGATFTRWFKILTLLAVLLSTVTFWIQVDNIVQTGVATPLLDSIETSCTVIFTIELLVRVCMLRYSQRLHDSPLVFDCIIVICAWVDFIVVFATGGAANMSPNILWIFTVARSARSFRLCRLVCLLPQIRVVLFTIVGTMDSLFWICVLMLCVMFVFGLMFTEGTCQLLIQQDDLSDQLVEELQRDFGKVSRSIYTLFMAANGGISWGEPASRARKLGEGYFVLFLAYIALMVYSVLNVVIGFFVDGAIQLMERDRDLINARAVEKNGHLLEDLRQILSCLDRNNDGLITWEEWLSAASDSSTSIILQAMGIEPSDAKQIFRLIDTDSSGFISIPELVKGVQRIRDRPSALQMDMLLSRTEAFKNIQKSVSAIHEHLKVLSDQTTKLRK
eukprot:TRINITY_DN15477_c0_g1_i1.p1 TRINITY_DN15477_c0_g1~~TRINITY_DN15477_c0_g1_i1.p1  ORF type:complete len:650 (-),score=89.70 TRINITY_DN15477_c0_g1_i1:117-2009(-)